ncbi:uncharacterized protein LOC106349815 [Brassica napus]|uniref:uncharacterized protein LOC106349815 n=1 Tax=Brassica napus TaxID=3708 RepID=UPI00207ACF99|nr:uncharacterized protein LOC106349815 [Brassica napus]
MQNSICTNVISFKGGATVDQAKPCSDLLVIELTIRSIDIARVLIDTGSSVDIIFKDTLEKMKIDPSEIVENPSPLVGLSGEATIAFGSINLAVKAGTMTKVLEFLVVDRPASYNVIMGTPWLNSIRAIPSTYHLCLKFPTLNRIKVIWGNPRVSQINALIEIASPKNKREVQRLTGRVAALNRFISRSTDKCLPFYDILRGDKKFEWSEESEYAFQQLKRYLATPPVLAKPVKGEPLILNIAVSATAVNGVLIMEERSEQKLIFYISKTLLDAESRYPLMEKLAYAVVTSARKLRLYFQSHTIVILTTFPLLTILHSPIQSGRLAKWAVELSEYDIEYRPRTSSKSQVLADFLVELPPGTVTNKEPNSTWFLHVDGSSSKQGSCIGIRLTSPTSEILEQSFRLGFHASNNEAEYETLIAELRLAHGLKIRNIHAYCDSQLVASQYSVKYEARDERMDAYLKLVQNLAQEFDCFSLTRIPRSENFQADALAALASSSDPGLERVIPVEFIEHPSIEPPIVINLIRDQDDDVDEVARQPDERSEQSDYGYDTPWLETIRAYITDGKLPPKKWAAGKIRTQAARYVTVNGEIYKWKLSGPLMTCLEGEMVRNVMEEVHSGSCGNHSGGRSLAVKMKRHRYYGPTMIGDCKKFARKCEKSQRHAPTIRQPAEVLSSITSPHGVPYEIVTNNGSQFISTRFEAFCEKRKIRLNKSTPRYIHNAMAKPRQSIRPF